MVLGLHRKVWPHRTGTGAGLQGERVSVEAVVRTRDGDTPGRTVLRTGVRGAWLGGTAKVAHRERWGP